MRTLALLITVCSSLALAAFADQAQPTAAPDAPELTRLLREFLAGASKGDPAVHERFWADDLIYTRASGKRVGKADILREVKAEATAPKPAEQESVVYTAEDIRVMQFDNTAVVAFRLVGTSKKGDQTEVANYFNTGTFVKRNGTWQAVAWQATKIPGEGEEKK